MPRSVRHGLSSGLGAAGTRRGAGVERPTVPVEVPRSTARRPGTRGAERPRSDRPRRSPGASSASASRSGRRSWTARIPTSFESWASVEPAGLHQHAAHLGLGASRAPNVFVLVPLHEVREHVKVIPPATSRSSSSNRWITSSALPGASSRMRIRELLHQLGVAIQGRRSLARRRPQLTFYSKSASAKLLDAEAPILRLPIGPGLVHLVHRELRRVGRSAGHRRRRRPPGCTRYRLRGFRHGASRPRRKLGIFLMVARCRYPAGSSYSSFLACVSLPLPVDLLKDLIVVLGPVRGESPCASTQSLTPRPGLGTALIVISTTCPSATPGSSVSSIDPAADHAVSVPHHVVGSLPRITEARPAGSPRQLSSPSSQEHSTPDSRSAATTSGSGSAVTRVLRLPTHQVLR